MATVLGLFAVLVGIVSVVCWIMVVIKMFGAGILTGILGIICGIYAFIWGWMNREAAGLEKVMPIWSVCILIVLIVNAVSFMTGMYLGAVP